MFRHHDVHSNRSAEALRIASLRKVYGGGEDSASAGPAGSAGRQVAALDGISLSLPAGSFTAVMGPSGSGKSTLLRCAAGLDQPTSGEVTVDGAEMSGGSESELTRFRRQRIGFLFQQFNLMPTLSVLQNVTLPLRLAGRMADPRRAVRLLEQVGLGDRSHDRPAQLTGGQQQRVALARALVTKPSVIFADEPTGALDAKSARSVLDLMWQAVHRHGQTVVMVTQDPVAASYADSVHFLAEGRLAGRLDQPTAETVAERMTQLGGSPTSAMPTLPRVGGARRGSHTPAMGTLVAA
ncbi:ABC transporter ATP-binding protein [Streptomyces oceani]|uniref:ABC transporter ATP-binding protein n=1 Tax=Streptomyces oceani TaxID=1075402 RepID=UPI000871BB9A|nr:ABC transporter ATP-binding protein [Streptomyces oceani]